MKFLTILEVSQKQAYIFASNKLKENVVNSAVIAKALGREYIERTLKNTGYTDEKNMVYSGGGHTILEFDSKDYAIEATKKLTETIYRDFDGLEVFAKTCEYRYELSPAENLNELTEALERKKALRAVAFHPLDFGIEAVDSTTLKRENLIRGNGKTEIARTEYEEEQSFYPEKEPEKKYTAVTRFDELGGEKNESNFIAVIHIDGNGMGNRVKNFYTAEDQKLVKENDKNASWNQFKKDIREFSEEIDRTYKETFREMCACIGENLKSGNLDALNLNNDNFPVRRLITAGDDICFVTEGRIGIEAAAKYIELLTKKERVNTMDHMGYSACAGVAIVHRNYPFYKAYELAEMLCSNAKRYGANVCAEGNETSASAIDWHIEFGELKDSIEDIRKEYKSVDGQPIYNRPYVIADSTQQVDLSSDHSFEKFRTRMVKLLKNIENYGSGKIKGLRGVLKQDKNLIENYIVLQNLDGLRQEMGLDQENLSLLFDEIELIDTYISLQ